MRKAGRVVIRADAGPDIGGGHVMRCLALAEALTNDGWEVTFVGTPDTPRTVVALADAPYGWLPLQHWDDPAEIGSTLPACDLLVIDHYGLDARYEAACRPWAGRILAIDDLADRRHDCDLLLDQTLGREAGAYKNLVPVDCRLLLGPDHALLRRQFANRRPTSAAIEADVRNVAIVFGCTDATRSLAAAMAAVRSALPTADIDVVIGSAAPHFPELRTVARELGCNLLVDVADMADVLASADILVLAAGSVTWEGCALARPMVLIPLAENQKGIAAIMADRAAAVVPEKPEDLTPVIRSLADDPEGRRQYGVTAGRVCDGFGAARTALVLSPESAADGRPIHLRMVTMAHASLLLEWQRAPETRRFARNPKIPSESEHKAWMRRTLEDPGCLFHLVVCEGQPAGFVRLNHRQGGAYEVSIATDPLRHGEGIEAAALRLVRRLVPDTLLMAEVLPGNDLSRALFVGAGYVADGTWFLSHPSLHKKRADLT
jgi:UDP-2,4-diacetamido-2,4,6-trideoxy-beta-L-altropyranose hydrolase